MSGFSRFKIFYYIWKKNILTLSETFWLNIICSLFASLIFLFIVLIFFKPKISISPFICKCKVEFEDDNVYHIMKIVNKSYFSAFDIKIELHLLKKYSTPPNGLMNTRFLPLSLVLNNISNIPPYRPKWWRKEASHAVRIRTTEDLSILLNDANNSIELRVSLRHGLTGLTKVYQIEYSDISEIKNGKFTYGTKFDYLKIN